MRTEKENISADGFDMGSFMNGEPSKPDPSDPPGGNPPGDDPPGDDHPTGDPPATGGEDPPEPKKEDPPGGGEGGEGGSAGKPEPKAGPEGSDPLWVEFQKKYPDVELPEGALEGKLSVAESFDAMDKALNDHIATNYESTRRREELSKLPSREFLKQVYMEQGKQKGKDWTEEQIEAHLNSMTDIAIDQESDRLKGEMEAFEKERVNKEYREAEVKLEKETLPKVKEESTKLLNEYIAEKQNSQSIDGFRFEDAERKKFFDDLPGFTEKKMMEVDGRKVIASEADMLFHKITTDPKLSNSLLPWLWMIRQGKLQGFSSDLIERVKDNIIGELSREPEKKSGESGDGGYDPDAFVNSSKTKK